MRQRIGGRDAPIGPNRGGLLARPAGDLEEYVRVASKAGKKPAAFVNACGQHWGQPLNGHLSDGTPVINSVCFGPANDTSGGHYLWCEA